MKAQNYQEYELNLEKFIQGKASRKSLHVLIAYSIVVLYSINLFLFLCSCLILKILKNEPYCRQGWWFWLQLRMHIRQSFLHAFVP